MPIALMVGSQFGQLRARGTCSLMVKEIQLLQKHVPDPDGLTARVRAHMGSLIEETKGELCSDATDVALI